MLTALFCVQENSVFRPNLRSHASVCSAVLNGHGDAGDPAKITQLLRVERDPWHGPLD
jgi:hypothetical protein